MSSRRRLLSSAQRGRKRPTNGSEEITPPSAIVSALSCIDLSPDCQGVSIAGTTPCRISKPMHSRGRSPRWKLSGRELRCPDLPGSGSHARLDPVLVSQLFCSGLRCTVTFGGRAELGDFLISVSSGEN